MAYIGPQPKLGQNREVDDISSGFNGSTTAFTLQVGGSNASPGSANNIIVSVNNIVLNPNTAYTVNGSTITFTSAPTNGHAFFGLLLGQGIDSGEVSNGSVSTVKLADDAVTSAKIADDAVVTAAINADAVTGAKIADDSINSEHYVDGSIDTAHIADDQITTAKVAAGNITATELGSDSVTGAKIAAGAINNANKIQDSIITGAKIGSGTIVAGNLATNAVTTAKIADDAVTAAKIADSTITSTQIANDAVTRSRIQDEAVDADRLAANAVTTAKIADDAITAAKLNDNSVVNAALDTVAQNRIKGRVSSGTGNVEDLTAAQVRTMINVADGATAGKILQVQSTAKTDTSSFSIGNGGTSSDVVTVSITPGSSSNKILIFATLTAGKSDTGVFLKLFRGSTQIALGDSDGSAQRVSTHAAVTQSFLIGSTTCVFLDSPSTTSSTTYSIRVGHGHPSTQTVFINEPQDNSTNSQNGRGVTIITVQEVAG